MDILLGIATTVHLGFAGDYNEIHPQVRFEKDHYIAGAFYNSEENISLYAGLQYVFDNGIFVEGGIVSGYDAVAPIVPFARAGYEINDMTNVFIAPAGEVNNTGELNVGLVLGLEVFFK